MKLFGMLDSPYVRRVAISLELYGIKFEHVPFSVFSHFEEFTKVNPVVKAPTLTLDNGQLLMDSTLIIGFFETLAPAEHQLLPKETKTLAEDLSILGLALAASEKAVQFVYEHKLRPNEKQHQPWVERVTGQLLAACEGWNLALKERNNLSGAIDQVSITTAVVWSFIQHMIPQLLAERQFSAIEQVTQRMESLPEFQKYSWR
ncbi:glutathione S-transferase family protein [Serratia sp. M24T3]|uniref:glutathione S-transferase family protein n=1 Tax=Serratia sp. M24T3 TaxID=932213 RepID=UPI00025BBDDA|nr:glutathione S-transferase [Serratia sp. M24T3]EIC86329.1 putative S-transferase [Serratia sp. M24T3]